MDAPVAVAGERGAVGALPEVIGAGIGQAGRLEPDGIGHGRRAVLRHLFKLGRLLGTWGRGGRFSGPARIPRILGSGARRVLRRERRSTAADRTVSGRITGGR